MEETKPGKSDVCVEELTSGVRSCKIGVDSSIVDETSQLLGKLLLEDINNNEKALTEGLSKLQERKESSKDYSRTDKSGETVEENRVDKLKISDTSVKLEAPSPCDSKALTELLPISRVKEEPSKDYSRTDKSGQTEEENGVEKLKISDTFVKLEAPSPSDSEEYDSCKSSDEEFVDCVTERGSIAGVPVKKRQSDNFSKPNEIQANINVSSMPPKIFDHRHEDIQDVNIKQNKKLQDKSLPKQILDKTQSKQILDKTQSKQILDKTQPKQILDKTQSKQILDKTQPKQILDETQPEQILDKRQSKQILDKTQSKQILDKTRSKQILDETQSKQILDKTQPEQMQEKTQPEQILDKAQPEQILDKTQPEQMQDKSQPEQIQDKRQSKHILDKTQPEQILDKTQPGQMRDKTQHEQLRDNAQPEQIQDKTQPEQMQDKTQSKQILNKTQPEQTLDKTQPKQILDETQSEEKSKYGRSQESVLGDINPPIIEENVSIAASESVCVEELISGVRSCKIGVESSIGYEASQLMGKLSLEASNENEKEYYTSGEPEYNMVHCRGPKPEVIGRLKAMFRKHSKPANINVSSMPPKIFDHRHEDIQKVYPQSYGESEDEIIYDDLTERGPKSGVISKQSKPAYASYSSVPQRRVINHSVQSLKTLSSTKSKELLDVRVYEHSLEFFGCPRTFTKSRKLSASRSFVYCKGPKSPLKPYASKYIDQNLEELNIVNEIINEDLRNMESQTRRAAEFNVGIGNNINIDVDSGDLFSTNDIQMASVCGDGPTKGNPLINGVFEPMSQPTCVINATVQSNPHSWQDTTNISSQYNLIPDEISHSVITTPIILPGYTPETAQPQLRAGAKQSYPVVSIPGTNLNSVMNTVEPSSLHDRIACDSIIPLPNGNKGKTMANRVSNTIPSILSQPSTSRGGNVAKHQVPSQNKLPRYPNFALLVYIQDNTPTTTRFRPIAPKITAIQAEETTASNGKLAKIMSPRIDNCQAGQNGMLSNILRGNGIEHVDEGSLALNLARQRAARLSLEVLKNIDEDQDTCLHIAVCQFDCHTIQAILERLAWDGLSGMINAQNLQGQTSLYLAVSINDAKMVQLLIEHGADVNTLADSKTNTLKLAAIHNASTRGDKFLNTLQALLRAPGIDLNLVNSDGYTALICAILAHRKVNTDGTHINSIPIIQTLIQAGADPYIPVRQNGKTALMYALEHHDLDLIEKTFELIEPSKLATALKTKAFNRLSCIKIAESLKASLNLAGQKRLSNCLKPGARREVHKSSS